MTAEDQIGGRFPGPCARIHVSGNAPGRLLTYQLPSVVCLGDSLVAGGQVGQNCRPMKRLKGTGRHGSPQILADFHTDDEVTDIGATKQQVRSKRNISAEYSDSCTVSRGCGG